MKVKGNVGEVFSKIEKNTFISYNENKKKFFKVWCELYPTILTKKDVAPFFVGSIELLSLDKYIKR